jgi:hypothetical protein
VLQTVIIQFADSDVTQVDVSPGISPSLAMPSQQAPTKQALPCSLHLCVHHRAQHRYQSRFAHASNTTVGVRRSVPLAAVQRGRRQYTGGSMPTTLYAMDKPQQKKCGHTTLVCKDRHTEVATSEPHKACVCMPIWPLIHTRRPQHTDRHTHSVGCGQCACPESTHTAPITCTQPPGTSKHTRLLSEGVKRGGSHAPCTCLVYMPARWLSPAVASVHIF